MTSYYIFLGDISSLSKLEAKTLLKNDLNEITGDVLELSISEEAINRFSRLTGGSIRIARTLLSTSSENLLHDLESVILSSERKNVAISNYSDHSLSSLDLKNLKEKISQQRPVRFLSFDTKNHSLVALRKQSVLELNILNNSVIAETVWIQNSDQWYKRDRKRPYQDIKRGMLPPKIARIMVNLAARGENAYIADPFCGTGTIAAEALAVGCEVFASDISKDAVEGTEKNLTWLSNEYNLDNKFTTKLLDATHLDEAVSDLDAIVTEPFMGPLISEKDNKLYLGGKVLEIKDLKNTITGLSKLYKGALKSFHKTLKDKGTLVMVFPEFHIHDRVYEVPLVDTRENRMYNKIAHEDYGKPDSIVRRQILVLEKNGKN